jgi:acetylornithine deacetylase/succinyl-diaminopimelate desuccinylase-like protein
MARRVDRIGLTLCGRRGMQVGAAEADGGGMAAADIDGVWARIDAMRSDAVALVRNLVRIPSDNPPGDCAAAAYKARPLIEALGFAVEAHDVPSDFVRAHGMISATNLIVRHRFGPGPTIALNAHGDVVPPGAGWTCDPYEGEIRDGWLYGRGAAVSKSDFATYGIALKALKDASLPLKGAVELHLTYDEEIGGDVGPGWILKQGLSKPDYAICAAFAYDVVTAHNGVLHLEATVRGKSAHAAWSETGHDALFASVQVLQALYAYRADLKIITSKFAGLSHPSLVVGLISGGINTNVVPDAVTFRIDRRILPDEPLDMVEADLVSVIQGAVAGLDGIRVETKRILFAKPFKPVGDAERFAGVLARHASRVMGESVGQVAVPLYTDARHYAEAGAATVMYGAGPKNPLDANGHRADERVPIETIPRAAKAIAATIAEMLG